MDQQPTDEQLLMMEWLLTQPRHAWTLERVKFILPPPVLPRLHRPHPLLHPFKLIYALEDCCGTPWHPSQGRVVASWARMTGGVLRTRLAIDTYLIPFPLNLKALPGKTYSA